MASIVHGVPGGLARTPLVILAGLILTGVFMGAGCDDGGAAPVTCDPGLIACDGTCIDPLVDNAWCGATGACGEPDGSPGAQCASNASCVAGSCVAQQVCPVDRVSCAGGCVDPMTDDAWCGATGACGEPDGSPGVQCDAGTFCEAGSCEDICVDDERFCDETCVDPMTDDAHCGDCGQACSTDAPNTRVSCVEASCVVSCAAGFVDCNGDLAEPDTDGCEAEADACVLAVLPVTFTGEPWTFTVPEGARALRVELHGAQGGTSYGPSENYGGLTRGTLAVEPGTVVTVFVGGQPEGIAAGYNGGGAGDSGGQGGGGATDLRLGGTSLEDRVLVAGGGGGAGFWDDLEVTGGAGGGLTGGDGFRTSFALNAGGKGATQEAGGADGTCVQFNVVALAGTFGQGGSPAGQGCGCEGFGGGGGWYGGAGSGNCRGGGGGSGYADPEHVTDAELLTGGAAPGNGSATITILP